MKKLSVRALSCIMIVLLLSVQVFMPVFAVSVEKCDCENKHVDPNELVGTLAATCKDVGLETYKCATCDGEYYVLLEKTDDHQWSATSVPEKGAECYEAGRKEYKTCDSCGVKGIFNGSDWVAIESDEDLVIATTPHVYTGDGTVVTEPTCTEGGYTTYTCQDENCTESHVGDETAALGHNLVIVSAQAADCTQIGWDEYKKCDRTNCGYTEGYKEYPKLVHPYKISDNPSETYEATCDAEGKITYVCQQPGCAKEGAPVVEIIPAKGHKFVTVTAVAVGCENDGNDAYEYCSVCFKVKGDSTVYASVDEIKEAKKIPATNHANVEPVGAKEPTCTEIGYESGIKCLDCGKILRAKAEIPALGHNMSISVSEKAATCQAEGHSAYTECSRCGHKEGYEVYNIISHNYAEKGTVEAKCEEDGFIILECQNIVEGGNICGDVKKEIIPATNHKDHLVTVPAQAPTCENDGWKEFKYCDICDALGDEASGKVAAENVIAKLGHSWKLVAEKPATVDEVGYTEGYICENNAECLHPDPEKRATVIPRLAEEITFEYEALGIKETTVAVNSGKVIFNVYMNVGSTGARLYAFDLDYAFGPELTFVSAETEAFELIDSNVIGNTVKLSPNMGLNAEGKKFDQGKYLVATLTFKVDSEFIGTTAVDFVAGDFARDTDVLKNDLIVDFGDRAEIEVVTLGDATGDGKVTSKDTLELAKWIGTADEDSYEAIYDLDKNGKINGDDFALIRSAAVGNTDYLNDEE